MRTVVVLPGSEMPTEMLGLGGLRRRDYAREAVQEFRYDLGDPYPKIPIRRNGTIELARWGYIHGWSRSLPRPARTLLAKVEAGEWVKYEGMPVEIAATFWYHGGTWMFVREGIRGILAPDEERNAVCYLVCEPASNHYRNMTGGRWMPVLIHQRY